MCPMSWLHMSLTASNSARPESSPHHSCERQNCGGLVVLLKLQSLPSKQPARSPIAELPQRSKIWIVGEAAWVACH
jgi:hypothetical protein